MNLYYLDRPAVPPAQQVMINLDAITDVAVYLKSEEIVGNLLCEAAEVRNADGEIEGTLVYIGGLSLADIVTPATGVDSDVAAIDEFPVDSVSEDITEDEFNAESKLADLDLRLAEAKKAVLAIEQEIANEEDNIG